MYLALANKIIGISLSEFWAMPFFMFNSLLEANRTEQQNKRTRKNVVTSLRYTRQKFGWQ